MDMTDVQKSCTSVALFPVLIKWEVRKYIVECLSILISLNYYVIVFFVTDVLANKIQKGCVLKA